jgi:hypothetical protein
LDEQEVLTRYQTFAAEYFKIAHDADPVGQAVRSSRQHTWQHRLTVVGLSAAALMVVISSVVALSPRSRPDHPTDISSPMQVPRPPVTVPPPAPSTEEPTAVPVPEAPPAEQPSAAPEPTTAPPREAVRTQQLAVTATETSWVQVTIDNRETREALLQPGERVVWAAEQAFNLTVGNAGGVTVEFNGEPLPALGPSGTVRTLALPRVAMTSTARAARTPAPPTPTAGLRSPGHSTPPALTSPPDSTTVPPQPLQ